MQVEHPVTEMVTGIDLIQEQIKVAQDKTLPFTQEDIQLNVRPAPPGVRCVQKWRRYLVAAAFPIAGAWQPPSRAVNSSAPPLCAALSSQR